MSKSIACFIQIDENKIPYKYAERQFIKLIKVVIEIQLWKN